MSNHRWDLDKVKIGLDKFYREFGRYPTATEFENYPHLPSARQMQRRFGGIVQLRETLGLEGPFDLTKGEYSSQKGQGH